MEHTGECASTGPRPDSRGDLARAAAWSSLPEVGRIGLSTVPHALIVFRLPPRRSAGHRSCAI
jgi:hypothetical protein